MIEEYFIYAGIPLIPIITALVELLKKSDRIDKKWLPKISIGLGVIAGFIFIPDENWRISLIYGLFMGLSAVGLFENIKSE